MSPDQNIGAVKIFGYLEKKGKMKVVTTWKKYWFVLEGRLLLYYRSQEEYENLSPCKGSINMGLAINIRPGLAAAGILEIVTRTNTITLRAKHRNIQEKWLQALLDASGQQSASSPVKMTHFRYSMDNLIPAPTSSKALTRQNTLPYRFNRTKPETKQLKVRLVKIGARTYGGSLDSIVKKTSEKMDQPHDENFEKNDIYGLNQVFLENPHYISTNDEKRDEKCDETCDEKCDEKRDENKNVMPENDELEYYCTYGDITQNGVYFEPDLPPRRTESDDASSYNETQKKESAFTKFAKKFRNFKTKMTHKKCDDIVTEPIYDTVNYLEINQLKPDENIVKTLLDLKQTLEEKKLKVKDILESATINKAEPVEVFPPGLPPRTGSRTFQRSPSPYHDTPKNNSPVSPQFPTTIDKILNDLEQEQKNEENEQDEELNVRQLIRKFNCSNTADSDDVNLRQKCEKNDDETSIIINRYSEDLNKLLEELTKVTSAPLLTPGVTSSLIQMKSPPVTDEEWLALTPIRRRRFSDPDYDVPRPHRSLQILPTDSADTPDEVIPATRFFGPVLSAPHTETWRSMTPDSLEPAQVLRRQHIHTTASDTEKDRSLGYEEKTGHPKMADCHVFMDSLEPLSEGATAF